MVKESQLIKNGDKLITIQEYLEKYHSKLREDDWNDFQKYIDDAFEIKTDADCEAFKKAFWVSKFDYHKMREFYERIKIEFSFFDDDILRYIAFLEGLGYFEMTGNPSLDAWLNVVEINQPFKKYDECEGFTINDVINLKYGGNAIRNKLLWAMRVIQGSFA